MLSGITARIAQALQINLEYSTDILCQFGQSNLSVSDRECRRRLMWSCYITDTFVSSGVDQLTLIDEKAIKIQLPCNERNFLYEIPCITPTLEPNQVLRFISSELIPTNAADNVGIMAYFVRHIATRRKILR